MKRLALCVSVLACLGMVAPAQTEGPSPYRTRHAEKAGPKGLWAKARKQMKDGSKLLESGKAAEAVPLLEEAEALYARTVDGYSWRNDDQAFGLALGRAYQELGRAEEAAAAYARSIAMVDPSLKGAKVKARAPLRAVLTALGKPEAEKALVARARAKLVASVKRELVTHGVGRKVRPFTLPKLGGAQVSSDDLRGKVVLLNFWGTW